MSLVVEHLQKPVASIKVDLALLSVQETQHPQWPKVNEFEMT